MQRMGIHATDMIVLEDILWPITQASACCLYFDENRRRAGWFITSS